MANPDDNKQVSPFPALHTVANKQANENVAAARKVAEEAESWLADLDALLAS